MGLRRFVPAVVAGFASVAQAEKEGNTFHPVISWTAPLDDQDFNNWLFQESSVALKNKVVLVPNGVEKSGFISNKWVSVTIPS